MPYIPNPRLLGRFNFFSRIPEVYQLMFVPYNGNITTIIAKDLNRQQMEDLKDGLNRALDDANKDIEEDLDNIT